MVKRFVDCTGPKRVIRCCRDTYNYFRVAIAGDRHPKGISFIVYCVVCRPDMDKIKVKRRSDVVGGARHFGAWPWPVAPFGREGVHCKGPFRECTRL